MLLCTIVHSVLSFSPASKGVCNWNKSKMYSEKDSLSSLPSRRSIFQTLVLSTTTIGTLINSAENGNAAPPIGKEKTYSLFFSSFGTHVVFILYHTNNL